MGFLELPPETIEQIIINLDPLDVSSLSQSARAFYMLIYLAPTQALWRSIYLAQPLDDPRTCVSQLGAPREIREIDWRGELQRIVRARTVCGNPATCRPGEQCEVLKTLLNLVTRVPPLAPGSDVAQNLMWALVMLRGGAFLDSTSGPSTEEAQNRAWLHTLFGLTPADAQPEARVASRARVYRMRNYGPHNDYGPFTASGCVDWVQVRALHHVVAMHVVGDALDPDGFEVVVFPMSLPFTQIFALEGREEDWAGVEGTWRMSFCYCDHRDLLRYNATASQNNALPSPVLFAAPDFTEEFRSMDYTLSIINSTHAPPQIHFRGSATNTSSNATVRGCVYVTRDAQIGWKFVSGDAMNPIWRCNTYPPSPVRILTGHGFPSSEGVQVGGARSAFGVLGVWTTVFHDAGDPVGPFWIRKIG